MTAIVVNYSSHFTDEKKIRPREVMCLTNFTELKRTTDRSDFKGQLSFHCPNATFLMNSFSSTQLSRTLLSKLGCEK
jgi:hypothetical protein